MTKDSDTLPVQNGISKYFMAQKYSFKALGIDPTSLNRTIFNRFLAWIPMVCMLTICGPITILAGKYTNNLYIMVNILTPLLQCVLGILKFNLFMWNKKKIVQMVRNVWLFNLKANKEELQILVEENYYDQQISMIYIGSALISAIIMILIPFLVASFYAWRGASFWESLDQPFKAEYYWDPHKSILSYSANFTWNIISIYFALGSSLSVDSLFSWFMRNISAQFRILNLRFKLTAIQAKHAVAQGNYTENDTVQSIIACVKYHRHVLEMAQSFTEVYKYLIFVKFLISCVQIAFLTFTLSRGGDFIILAFNFSFMVTVGTQLMLYCHGGQKIADLSVSVGSTIYESFEWHELSVKVKKLLLLPMMRAQKACNVTGIIFVLQLSLFLWVYRAAGSFLTMMISVEDRK